jgi:hypothetical protein
MRSDLSHIQVPCHGREDPGKECAERGKGLCNPPIQIKNPKEGGKRGQEGTAQQGAFQKKEAGTQVHNNLCTLPRFLCTIAKASQGDPGYTAISPGYNLFEKSGWGRTCNPSSGRTGLFSTDTIISRL